MKKLLIGILSVSSLSFVSCFGPKFQCEKTETGVCAPPNQVYKALYKSKRLIKRKKSDFVKVTPVIKFENPQDYRTPERIYRIWITTYVDKDGHLVGNHYVYVAVPGKWNFPKVSNEEFNDDVDYNRLIKSFLKKQGGKRE